MEAVHKIASEQKYVQISIFRFFVTLDKSRFLKTLHQLRNVAHDYPEEQDVGVHVNPQILY